MNDSQKWLALASLFGIGWLIYLFSPVLTPFVAGAMLAYRTDPLADRLEAVGLRRLSAVIIVFGIITLIAALSILVVLPVLEHQVGRAFDKFP